MNISKKLALVALLVPTLAACGDGSPRPSAPSEERSAEPAVTPATAETCAKAYAKYRKRKVTQLEKTAPAMPLPDFFIGAHAKIMDWHLATADQGRFTKYFPSVSLRTPPPKA